jgi:hypothetical protein
VENQEATTDLSISTRLDRKAHGGRLKDAQVRGADQKVQRSPTRSMKIRVGQVFNPYKLFTGIFIPEALLRYRGLSSGAKLVYGRLSRYAGENGECYPSIPALAVEIGLSSTQTRTYVHELRDQRFITIESRAGTSGMFSFLWHEAFFGVKGDPRKIPPLRKTGPPPTRITGPPPLRKTGDEDNHHQDSQVKENREAADTRQQVSKTARLHTHPEADRKDSHLKIDDENTNLTLTICPVRDDPRQEFKALTSARHPEMDAEYVLDFLSKDLSANNLSLREFLAFDAKHTTNPRTIKNPAGYYRDLSKKLNAQVETAALDERLRLIQRVNEFCAIPNPIRPTGPKCPVCCGIEGEGVVLSSDRKSFEPCSCATQEFAARFREKESARKKNVIELAAAINRATVDSVGAVILDGTASTPPSR